MKHKLKTLLARFGLWLWINNRSVTATEMAILREAESRRKSLWVHIDCRCERSYCVDFTEDGQEHVFMIKDEECVFNQHKHIL